MTQKYVFQFSHTTADINVKTGRAGTCLFRIKYRLKCNVITQQEFNITSYLHHVPAQLYLYGSGTFFSITMSKSDQHNKNPTKRTQVVIAMTDQLKMKTQN